MQFVDDFRQQIMQGDQGRKRLNWIILDVYINKERVELLFVNMFETTIVIFLNFPSTRFMKYF